MSAQVSAQECGRLYIVGTPLGHLGDMSYRAVETLSQVDLILCEDTRTSAKLLDHYGIKTKRKALHDHNEGQQISAVLDLLQSGQNLALISDAGMPLISDPGYRLVTALRAQNMPLAVIPGPTAVTSALAISGLVPYPFYFGGFFAHKSSGRQKQLQLMANTKATLAFYESPQRLLAALADIQQVLGERQVAVARELTKIYEEVIGAPVSQVIAHYEQHKPKGEIVILIAAPEEQEENDESWQKALTRALKSNKLSSAVKQIANIYPVPKHIIYDYALELKNKEQTPEPLE